MKNTGRKLSNSRDAVAKRLRRRGILKNIRGVSTQELINLWEKYKDKPVMKMVKPSPKQTNFETIKTMLENFTEDYVEYFINRYRDAWRYLPGIKFFYQRLNKDVINNDENFEPIEVKLYEIPPSDYMVDDEPLLPPEKIEDHLEKLFFKYLR